MLLVVLVVELVLRVTCELDKGRDGRDGQVGGWGVQVTVGLIDDDDDDAMLDEESCSAVGLAGRNMRRSVGEDTDTDTGDDDDDDDDETGR